MLSALENFVFLSQSVFNCDREFMFSTLAKAYRYAGSCRTKMTNYILYHFFNCSNNCTKMSEVWVRMQEDGFVPSDRLKGIMAVPFVAEQKPIPFHVPVEGIIL